jgi:transposase
VKKATTNGTFRVVLGACEIEFLQYRDTLICDIAAVYAGRDSVKLLKKILDTLFFLPAYSPELNSYELVFSLFKRILRRSNPNDILNIKERDYMFVVSGHLF